jgi:hypothetical protein
MPAFGLGTWRMGEHPDHFQRDSDVIRAALDLCLIPQKCMVKAVPRK